MPHTVEDKYRETISRQEYDRRQGFLYYLLLQQKQISTCNHGKNFQFVTRKEFSRKSGFVNTLLLRTEHCLANEKICAKPQQPRRRSVHLKAPNCNCDPRYRDFDKRADPKGLKK